jgi:hypothetical protein
LTILNFSRSWTLTSSEWNKVESKISSITDPPKGDLVIDDYFLSSFVKDFKLKLQNPTFSYTDIFLSYKSGPQGPASKTSLNNIPVLKEQEINNLMNLTNDLGKKFLSESIKDCRRQREKALFPFTGKLSHVHDPEAKLRIIAISDYYTQVFLKPIHKDALSLLKKFSSDRTFTQNPFHKWTDNGERFHSLDLSSATDRFPISLQERLLSFIYDNNISSNWRQLLSNKEFVVDASESTVDKDGNLLKGDYVTYATGQPMGTYSSWAVFTLTHHFIVYYCAKLCNLNNFKQYIILGDDIVIKNDEVATKYVEVMTKLGVDISVPKTHVSNNTYEFAKR